jgi:hypothetical protein
VGSVEPPLPDELEDERATIAVDPYENLDPTVKQLTIPLGDQPRKRQRRTRRKS